MLPEPGLKTPATVGKPRVVAGIHGLEQTGNSHALILELVKGEDLSDHLKRGPLPLEEALDVCRQIAEALEAARERAQQERTTLNNVFREWLVRYAAKDAGADRYRQLMQNLRHVSAGGKFSRDQLNER